MKASLLRGGQPTPNCFPWNNSSEGLKTHADTHASKKKKQPGQVKPGQVIGEISEGKPEGRGKT